MLWVAVLNVSVRTAQKLSSKHGLSEAEVRMAIVGVKGLRYVWDDSPDGRGLRVIVETNINGRRVLVVLYPCDDPFGDTWNLGSAHVVT